MSLFHLQKCFCWRILGWQVFFSFLSVLVRCYFIIFWLTSFLMRSLRDSYHCSSIYFVFFFLATLKIVKSLIKLSILWCDFLCIYHGLVHWVSWVCGCIVFNKFGNFSVIISLNIFFLPFFCDSNYSYVRLLDVLSQVIEYLLIFLFCAVSSSSFTFVSVMCNPLLINPIQWIFLFHVKKSHLIL